MSIAVSNWTSATHLPEAIERLGGVATLAPVVDRYAHMKIRRRGTPPVALSAVERTELVAFLQTLDSAPD